MNTQYKVFGLIGCLMLGSVQAELHSNKTFYTAQPVRVTNSVVEFTHDRHREATELGGTLEVTPFYRHSVGSKGIGQYLGFATNNVVALGTNIVSANIIHGVLVAEGDRTVATLAGNVTLLPKRQEYGAVVSYTQNLDKLLEHLWASIELPIVHVDNDLGLTVDGQVRQTIGAASYGVLDYFQGGVTQGAGTDQQNALLYAKLSDKDRSKTGVADVALKVGYDVVNEEQYGVRVYGHLVLPTGSKPRAEYLYEAVVGYNQHWGLGAGLDSVIAVYNSDDLMVNLGASLQGTYRFENSQQRTLGLNAGAARLHFPWSAYYLAGSRSTGELSPYANIATKSVKVAPGMEFNSVFNLNLKTGHWVFDGGYRHWARQGEKVNLKTGAWTDGIYALADGGNYDATAGHLPFGSVADDILTEQGAAYISQAMLDLNAAAAPATTTHTLYGNAGYNFDVANVPCSAGLGLSYEIAPENAVFSLFQLSGSFAVSF